MLKRGYKHPVRRVQFTDANTEVPETLTQAFIEAITSSLVDGEKLSYLKRVFMEKYVSKDTDPSDVRRQRAINKWLSVEADNEATESRIEMTECDFHILPHVRWDCFVNHLQAVITDIIGDVPPFEILFGGFSGGATTTKSRTESHPALKYLGKAEITPAARKWFDDLVVESPLWTEYLGELVITNSPGNHMFTVPKSTTIDRVAAKEPDLNMYMQKGVGNFFRSALRRKGINLNDQTRNRDLARLGSISNRLATLDLSSASDSVTRSLVELCLPPLWFGLLDDLRSPFTRIPDGNSFEWHRNYMFSSMGNGFTFELESLLFYAIAKSVRHFRRGSGVISVYGDDIIVGSDYAEHLSWVLSWVGFSVNSSKSFINGPFRESCGGHYWNGVDITPFYLRAPISRLRDVIKMANQLRRWSIIPGLGMCDPTFEELWKLLKSFVPEEFWGGDDLESTDQLVCPVGSKTRLRLVGVPGKTRSNGVGGYLLWLNTCEGSTGSRDVVQTSDRSDPFTRYRAKRVKAEYRCPTDLFYEEIVGPPSK